MAKESARKYYTEIESRIERLESCVATGNPNSEKFVSNDDYLQNELYSQKALDILGEQKWEQLNERYQAVQELVDQSLGHSVDGLVAGTEFEYAQIDNDDDLEIACERYFLKSK